MTKKVPERLLTQQAINDYFGTGPSSPDSQVLQDWTLENIPSAAGYPDKSTVMQNDPTELVRRWLVMDSLQTTMRDQRLSTEPCELCQLWALCPTGDNWQEINIQRHKTSLAYLITGPSFWHSFRWIAIRYRGIQHTNSDTAQALDRARFYWWLDLLDMLPEPVTPVIPMSQT